MRRLVFCSALTVQACGLFDSGGIIKNSSKLTSTSLALTAEACLVSASTCTPTNLEGRIFAAGAMLGKSSKNNGEDNYNMTFLADSDEVIEDPSKTSHPAGKTSFNLASPAVFSGKIAVPGASDMPDPPVIWRLETYFDYIDATFVLTGTDSMDGTYTIRSVFRKTASAGDVTGTMQLGDKLIRKKGETAFRWCTTEDCSNTTRPTSPLQDSRLLAIDKANDSQPGNPNYALYSIDLTKELTVDHDTISDETRLWQVDFSLAGAIKFVTVPSGVASEKGLVTSFGLGLGCNTQGCSADNERIRATLSIGDKDSAS